jgi:Uncharacterised protein family (UPF0158)
VNSTPPRSVPVRYTDIESAFEFANFGQHSENSAYLCRNTGNIYCTSTVDDSFEEAPEDLEESDQYIALPDKNDLDLGRKLVFDFVREQLPDEWSNIVDIFRKKGAYAQFKQMLAHHDALDKWYAFEASSVETALREWCRNEGIPLIDG